MNKKYTVTNLEERKDLYEQADEICCKAWPEFMLHDNICNKYWLSMINNFSKYQILLTDKKDILAIINSVPINFNSDLNDLPDSGWDWALEKSIIDFNEKKKPNILVGIQVVINPNHRNCGLSYSALNELKKVAKDKGFNKIIIPVRPSNKNQYPLQDMNSYLNWTNENKLPFDNWLRVHLGIGGKILKVCSKAMLIEGTINDWEKWTGIKLFQSGQHIIPGALNPIMVDMNKNVGVYIEPNVWVVHKCI